MLLEETYTKGKIDLIAQLCADDFVMRDPVAGEIDRRGFEQHVQTYRKAFPDLKIEVIDQIVSGDRVMSRWRATGTHQGDLMGIPATNKKGMVEGLTVGRYANGKLVESYSQWDVMGLMRQLGITSPMQMRPNGGGAAKPGAPPQPRR